MYSLWSGNPPAKCIYVNRLRFFGKLALRDHVCYCNSHAANERSTSKGSSAGTNLIATYPLDLNTLELERFILDLAPDT